MFKKDISTFRGGVHPYEGKELTKDKAIVPVMPRKILYFSLSQHIGAPAKPIVEKGAHVLVGQKIAEAGGFVSAPVYSSVSGVVKGIEKKVAAGGSKVDCIVVENDGTFESVGFSERPDWQKLSKKEIISIIQDAGVVGMGGAGFPTHVKLSPKDPESIDHILVNGSECEPYLTSDYRRMLEEPEKVLGGLRIMLSLFDKAKGVICIEDNKKDCIRKFRQLIMPGDRIEVLELKTKYPQGAERMLIYAATGRQINSSMLPADAGCIVDNIDTVVAVYKAVRLGEPLMHRIVTVTGDAVADPKNFYTPIGMLMSELLEEAGGLKGDAAKIIAGGPMMGNALYTLDVPVMKTTSALTCLTHDEVSAMEPSACINCGRCASVCPGRVIPAKLSVFSEHGDEESFLKYNGMECCECGCCSFICPARRPLTQSIKSMRKVLLAKKKKGA
ncbi:MAG: electron transport complex subunit RsxC [Fusicatenibacter sp.]|nr:electron transport complex subunit RsxC [Fusicatenibacter sp.]